MTTTYYYLLAAFAAGFLTSVAIVFIGAHYAKRVLFDGTSRWRPFGTTSNRDRVEQLKRLLDAHAFNTYGGVDENKVRCIAAYWISDLEGYLLGSKTVTKLVRAQEEQDYLRRYKAVA